MKSENKEETKKMKLGSVSIKSMKKAKKDIEEADSKRGGSRVSRLVLRVGKSYLWIIPPVSEKMNGQPFAEVLKHSDLGPNSRYVSCVRINMLEEREKCPGCRFVNSLWTRSRALKKSGGEVAIKEGEALEAQAKESGAKPRRAVQVLDVTGMYNKTGKIVASFPTCFGENVGTEEEKHPKCHSCPFMDSCQKGVQIWEMQGGPFSYMMEKISEEEIDICNPSKARPLKIVRKGTTKTDTKYTTELANSVKIPPNVVSFVEQHVYDLTELYKPSTIEEMNKVLVQEDDDVVNRAIAKVKELDVSEKKQKKHTSIMKPTVSKKQKAHVREKLKAIADKKRSTK